VRLWECHCVCRSHLLTLKELVDFYEVWLRRQVAECYLDAKHCNPVGSAILNGEWWNFCGNCENYTNQSANIKFYMLVDLERLNTQLLIRPFCEKKKNVAANWIWKFVFGFGVKSKVKQSHYTPWRRLRERRYSSYSFSISALDGGEWSVSRPGRALPTVPIVQEAGWSSKPVWTQRLQEKYSAPARDRTSIARVSSPQPDTILTELPRLQLVLGLQIYKPLALDKWSSVQ
jgi:hypothetical protein